MKSSEIWGLFTWALRVGLLAVSSFSCAGDVQADPESLISPTVFLIALRKLSLKMPSGFCRTGTNNSRLLNDSESDRHGPSRRCGRYMSLGTHGSASECYGITIGDLISEIQAVRLLSFIDGW